MKYLVLLLIPLILCSCSAPDAPAADSSKIPVTTFIQDFGQLHIDVPEGYKPINYDIQIGQWFPYMQYEDYMYGKSAEEFRTVVHERFAQAKENGVNTVYLHIHPCGDAYYKSDIFPKGVSLDGDYDPLSIMLEEAHKLELSAHGWLNPLRCQTTEQMAALPDDFIIKKWAEDPECRIAKLVGNRWYLDPSYTETSELLSACVSELLENYDLDGIHIDDYFYPSSDENFDSVEFEKSGSSDLAQWRLDNCTRFVKTIYDTVKSHDSRILFGISPQGNIESNYNSQYADVKLWTGSEGYCDYIVPQIYFGFENAVCPFEPTLRRWEELRGNSPVKLVIGLAVYKQGKEDKWAGQAGEREWIDNNDIISRQIELVKSSSADGYALY